MSKIAITQERITDYEFRLTKGHRGHQEQGQWNGNVEGPHRKWHSGVAQRPVNTNVFRHQLQALRDSPLGVLCTCPGFSDSAMLTSRSRCPVTQSKEPRRSKWKNSCSKKVTNYELWPDPSTTAPICWNISASQREASFLSFGIRSLVECYNHLERFLTNAQLNLTPELLE